MSTWLTSVSVFISQYCGIFWINVILNSSLHNWKIELTCYHDYIHCCCCNTVNLKLIGMWLVQQLLDKLTFWQHNCSRWNIDKQRHCGLLCGEHEWVTIHSVVVEPSNTKPHTHKHQSTSVIRIHPASCAKSEGLTRFASPRLVYDILKKRACCRYSHLTTYSVICTHHIVDLSVCCIITLPGDSSLQDQEHFIINTLLL